MGLLDSIMGALKGLFGSKKDGAANVRAAMDAVKLAVQNGDYDDASIKAFYAFEAMGTTYLQKPREEAQTAREYLAVLLEEVKIPQDEMMPLVYAFEVAKYSPESVTADQFLKADEALKLFEARAKAGGAAKVKEKGGGRRPKQRRQRGTGTAARRRRRKGRRAQSGE
ncbi:MAG: DUF4129 domain-containing protein [Methanobacteriota archaeon]|nr:MAG: DUF4129 domain-containing protein [Euryarchaeota archaeon]